MNDNLIEQYAFEIFSKTKILNIEFEIFQIEQSLKDCEPENAQTSYILTSRIETFKKALEELKTQLNEFKKTKNIGN
jgi:hypothetical protein